MKLQRDLREFVALLSSLGVEFIVVGGHAVAYHGHPRYTGDIDFLVRPTPENAKRVLEAIRQFGFGALALTEDDFVRPGSVVQLGRPPNRIDLLTTISGVDFEAALAGQARGSLDGIDVAFLGLTQLLQNKQAAGRAKDLADIEALRAAAESRSA